MEDTEKRTEINGVLLDIENNEAKVVTFVPNLQNYYRMLHCCTIDIVERKIGVRKGKRFDIVCDDEGLLKNEPKISAINDMGAPMLVGSLLVVGLAKEGLEQTLSDEDAEFVMEKIKKMRTRLHPEGYLMLTQCEDC